MFAPPSAPFDPFAAGLGAPPSCPPAAGFVEVEAWTRDGRSGKARVDLAPGHPKRELSWDEVAEKFKDCATSAGLTPAVASHLILRLGDLRSARDMQSLLLAMRPES